MARLASALVLPILVITCILVGASSLDLPHTSLQLCPVLEGLQASDSLETMLDNIQNLAISVGRDVKSMLASRCSSMESCECSRNMCSDSLENLECSPHVVRASVCSSGGCEASPMDFGATSVHSASLENGQLEKEFICGLTGLHDTLKSAWDQQEGLIWLYFGSFNGVFRKYPGHLWDCVGRRYDNRIRPWYRAASSGLKDVVVVMDVSGSMGQAQRLQLVKNALTGAGDKKGLLDMLTHNDHVSVVTFSEAATALQIDSDSTRLARATIDNVEKLKDAVSSITEQSTTNFMAGIQEGFDILIEGTRLERTSDCKRIMVFLTDGEDSFCNANKCEAQHPLSDVQMTGTMGECRCIEGYLETIESFQAELLQQAGQTASIFTYSMSADADDNIPRQIACRNGGSWGNIKDGDDPLTQMSSFFNFLAESVDEEVVYWTEPYLGFTTGAMQTTAATPVFDNTRFKTLLGVVGIDVHLGQVQDKFGTNFDQLLQNLQVRSNHIKSCAVEPSACQKQVKRLIRAGDEGIVDASCPANVPADQCCYHAGSKRVVLVRNPKSWADAQAFCQANFRDGQLASPTNGAGLDHSALHVLAGIAPPDGAWLGLQDAEGSAAWSWTDGTTQTVDNDKVARARECSAGVLPAMRLTPGGAQLWGYLTLGGEGKRCAFIDQYLKHWHQQLSTEPWAISCTMVHLTAGVSSSTRAQAANGTGLCAQGAAPFDFAASDAPEKVLPPEACQEALESFVRECEEEGTAGVQEFCAPQSNTPWEERAQSAWCCNLAGEHKFQGTAVLQGITKGQFDDGAEAFQEVVADLAGAVGPAAVSILSIEESPRRAASLAVDFEVRGFVSEEAMEEARKQLQRRSDGGELLSGLRADPAFAYLTAAEATTSSSSSSGPAVAVIVVACVVPALCLLALGAWWFKRSRSQRPAPIPPPPPPPKNPGVGAEASGRQQPEQSAPPLPASMLHVSTGSDEP